MRNNNETDSATHHYGPQVCEKFRFSSTSFFIVLFKNSVRIVLATVRLGVEFRVPYLNLSKHLNRLDQHMFFHEPLAPIYAGFQSRQQLEYGYGRSVHNTIKMCDNFIQLEYSHTAGGGACNNAKWRR